MALSTYSRVNYEVEVPLSREYSRETVHPAGGTYGSEPQYKYTRRTRKTYRFKGMSSAAATECADAKRRQYCRRFMGWKMMGHNWRPPSYFSKYGMLQSSPPDYWQQVAEVNVIRTGAASVFDVQITIDESVVIYGTWDYDINTAIGCDNCEARFRHATQPVSYVNSYDYDENLT